MNISGYVIDKQIGKGGMAMVYRATQESLGRPVALKVMNPLFADDPEFSERFLNEGRLLAAVHHSNIITIHDIGISDGFHFISMEYVEGGDLADKINEGLNPSQATAYLETLAECLAVAHTQHIVHRDIKPANILFRKDDTLLLTDFGIAKRLNADKGLTATGAMVGSPHYLSPEQAQGKAVDGRADIYSLGVVYYEMLTGQRPFTGDSDVDVAIKHVTGELPKLPDELAPYAEIIKRMMRKNPDERFPSCQSLLAALLELRETGRWSGEIADIAISADPHSPATSTEVNVSANAPGSAGDEAIARTLRNIPPRTEADGDTLVLHDASMDEGDTIVREIEPHVLNAETEVHSSNDDDGTAAVAPSERPDVGRASPKRRNLALALMLGVILIGAGSVATMLNGRTTPNPQAIAPAITKPAVTDSGTEKSVAPEKAAMAKSIAQEKVETAKRVAQEKAAQDRRQREFLIESLLRDAEAAIADYRLTTPEASSAYTYYQKVLEMAPEHPAAIKGIDDIAGAYYRLAKDAEQDWAYEKAVRFVNAGLSIRPEHAGLRALRQSLWAGNGKTRRKIKSGLKGVKRWFN